MKNLKEKEKLLVLQIAEIAYPKSLSDGNDLSFTIMGLNGGSYTGVIFHVSILSLSQLRELVFLTENNKEIKDWTFGMHRGKTTNELRVIFDTKA